MKSLGLLNMQRGIKMRTERIGIALTKEEKAFIILESSRLHISMSALIRMKVFAKPEQQIQQTSGHARPWEYTEETFTITTKRKRILPLIPGTPRYKANEHYQNKHAVRDELKIRLDERRKILEEEALLDEVGIK